MEKKLFKVVILTILLFFVYTNIASAMSFTATMTPSSTNVEASTEFTVSIKVSNLDVGDNGINTLSGTLKYDTSVFETISDSSIDGLNSWSPTFNSENNKITLTKTTFVKNEESVFQITFKTKSGVKDGKTGKIDFTSIKASNSESEITASDISTTITIGNPDTNTANTTNTNTKNNLTTNSKSNTNTNTNPVVDSFVNSVNTVGDDIPHTGAEDTLVVLILAVVIASIVFYVKFEKVSNQLR